MRNVQWNFGSFLHTKFSDDISSDNLFLQVDCKNQAEMNEYYLWLQKATIMLHVTGTRLQFDASPLNC